ncbi:MAG: PDZ domain-containing protein, partial [Gammaproteobacteria bacterium]|nr:PDZ domain-containing protein [Gammaproteobacteria bacterium]
MALRPITIIGVVVSMLGGVSLGVAAFWSAVYYDTDARHERLLVSAAREIQGSYIAEVDPDDLVDNAIRGMVEGLDGHSAFLDNDALVVLDEETTGRFGGIGIEVGMVDGLPTVIAPITDGPAERAGIAPGDRLIEVDHRALEGRTLSDAVRDLRGEPGTPVHVRIKRPARTEPLDFDLTRDSIASVVSRLLATGTGYIRIYTFDRSPR